MPILSICDERLEQLARRKKALAYRIALQRADLDQGFQRLRHPLASLDRAKAVGARLAENGPIVAMVLVPLLFLLRRPLVGGLGLAARLARKAARWWTLWKIGSKMFNAMPRFARR